jgi:hypothetical protein
MRGFEQQGLDDNYRRFQEAQGYPQRQVEQLGRALGINYGSSQTSPGANGWGRALGTGLAAYGAYNGYGGGGKG